MRNIFSLAVSLLVGSAVFGQDIPLSQILPEKSSWQPVVIQDRKILALAGNPDGSLLLAHDAGVSRLDKNQQIATVCNTPGVIAILPLEDGSIYLSHPNPKRILHLALGKETPEIFCEGLAPTAMALLGKGKIYADLPNDPTIHLVEKNSFRKVDNGPCASLALDVTGSTLFAGLIETLEISTFRVRQDGNLDAKDFYVAPRKPRPGDKGFVTDIKVDSLNRIYAASTLGVQVFDPTGRLCGVMINPPGNPANATITIAGETLFILMDGKVFQRPLLMGKK